MKRLALGLAGAVLLSLGAQGALPSEISGTLRDTNGAPLVGMEVEVFPGGGHLPSKTDTNGAFQIQAKSAVSPNANIVIARDRPRNLAAVRDLEAGTDVYDIQLASASIITGRVLNEQGLPLTNAEVTLLVSIDNSLFCIDRGISAKTDAQGHFEMRAVPMGRSYAFEVTAKGYGTFPNEQVKLETNRWELAPMKLRRADAKVAGVVVDSQNKRVKGAYVSIAGQGQPYIHVNTDEAGHFLVNGICDGTFDIRASCLVSTSGRLHRFPDVANGMARVKGGDTNIVITLDKPSELPAEVSDPKPKSLIGQLLPDLSSAAIPAESVPTNKPLLVCLFDPEQRPSRRVVQLLKEQKDSLKGKVAVIEIVATLTTIDALNQWRQSNPFPVGGVAERSDKTKWILEPRKVPCLILTDAQGKVKAEGFVLEDLDAKLAGPPDTPEPEPKRLFLD